MPSSLDSMPGFAEVPPGVLGLLVLAVVALAGTYLFARLRGRRVRR